jgi:hypothetical protein
MPEITAAKRFSLGLDGSGISKGAHAVYRIELTPE